MYQIDTSIEYSLPSLEQVGYAVLTQLLIASRVLSRETLWWQPELVNAHKVIRS